MSTLPPLVIVEGFLGASVTSLWGPFEKFLNWNCDNPAQRRRVIFTSVGPVSSLHDRACELYYALKGGTVDYGQQHTSNHGHARYGRHHPKGLFEEWSAQYPLHFLGHSMGGATIVKLQSLIQRGHFGVEAQPEMFRSITAVSSPFRGTQLVYSLGESTNSAPSVRRWSFGTILSATAHMVAFLSPILPRTFDLHADSRALSYLDSSWRDLLKQLWKSDWAESRDAAPYDVTFEAVDERESLGECKPHPTTFYRSHVACMTRQISSEHHRHIPSVLHGLTSPIMYFSARLVGSFDFSTLHPPPSFIPLSQSHDIEKGSVSGNSNILQAQLGEEYWANDGVVPLFSQWHPNRCSPGHCLHDENNKRPMPGIWHVHSLDGASHMSLLPIWMSSKRQKVFWGKLGDWLHSVDMQSNAASI
ncbi:alpha/beta-hydrolase [Mycena floridula]|nr:alpha/beta-hydrolase [Mycena floridula]